MVNSSGDMWSEWLLRRRFGGDPTYMQEVMDSLYEVRDKILAQAQLPAGGKLLDVGTGDGLIGFGALNQDPDSRVVFSDISVKLITMIQTMIREMDLNDRCHFAIAPADNLRKVSSSTIDAVTTRSVLIYVDEKQAAFDEFYRVLKVGGRLSIFEPINRFHISRQDGTFWGYDLGEHQALGQGILDLYRSLQPAASDPMLNFDERDLYAIAIQAGFDQVGFELHVDYQGQVEPGSWERILTVAGNPKIPTLAEAMRQVLSPDEQAEFEAVLRPLVESGTGKRHAAGLYLWAQKSRPS
jgi:SAM-dependent methyltransferase